ncbi:MFS transporter [Neomoorella humiferrea]|uniref:MFS transporter n=1 Tax=Neomoorella humiferrea TaxID=676965 RepID=UPI003D8C5793
MHKEWVDGLNVSRGNPEYGEDFLTLLRYLKSKAMKLKIDTNGKNSELLGRILKEGLADMVVMEVLGPKTLYSQIAGETIDFSDIEKTISIVPQFPQYRFYTTVVPVIREEKFMSTVWSFFCLATAWMHNYSGLLFTRLMVGMGCAGYNTAGYALIGAWFPPRKRGLMTGLFNTGQPLGAFVGVGIAGWLAG